MGLGQRNSINGSLLILLQDEDVEPRKGLVSPARIQAKMKKKFRKLKKT